MLRLTDFTYYEPDTVDEALAIKTDVGPVGMFVAGGTDLLPNMKRRHQEPRTLISLSKIERLTTLTKNENGTTTLGAGLTLTQIAEDENLQRDYRAVTAAAAAVSTPLLRNMGTLGGNLCLDTRCNYYNQSYEWRKAINFCMKKDGDICWVAPSSPRCWAVQSSDVAPVMVSLEAEYVLVGPNGERIIPASRFYHDDGINYLTRQPDEILTEVRLPVVNGWDATYHKLRRRGSFDFPVLGVAAYVQWDGSSIADARVILGGVASYPQPIPEAATALIGTGLEDDAIDSASDAAFKPAKPMDNTDFGLAWRKEMARQFVRRAMLDLRDRKNA
jgi:4-hydroxybenzoyl-CoA reductase subunit beta